MCGPKITVIGAGSYFFGKAVIHKMATSPVMAGGELALVDTDPQTLETMMRLARSVFDKTGCQVKISGSTDRRQVLADSDFVVLTFSERNAYFRGLDTETAARHGIRMCSSDTIGPGGIFRALREIPHALAMTRDVQELAPEAWVINFVNPTAVLGIALQRYAPKVRSFAVCDGLHEPYYSLRWCYDLGILPPETDNISPDIERRLDIAIAGVNHCTWITRFRYDGKDMFPAVRQRLLGLVDEEAKNPSEKAKPRYNNAYALQLFDIYGAYPVATSHTKEYVPFFQGYGASPVEPEPLRLFDAANRSEEMADAWKITCEYAAGVRSSEEFIKNVHNDHATDIIESMWGKLGKSFYVNTLNDGAVSNLSADAFLELKCHVDMHGPRPLQFGAFPRGLSALQQQIIDTHELTAEAAVTGDRSLLLRAMLTDPLCNNIGDARGCMEELLQLEREALPEYWYKG
ncbi:MAG: glycoside hydrolase family 4 [bacterium]|nr:glycoside hydrolase family 4 [bacterium]